MVTVGTRADALQITGLTPALGGTNTANSTTNSGNNRMQAASALSTVLAPSAAADTPGSFTEFIVRYALLVAADREGTGGGSTTTNMTSAYQITFTVDNPTGGDLKIDIDTLRVGALTSISDDAGNSTITLGAVTAQLDAVNQPGLGAMAVTQTSATGTANAETTFSQPGTTLTILTNAVSINYVLDFSWTSSVVSNKDEGAIRMGLSGGLTGPTEADDYPGVAFPRNATQQANDGHFVDVKVTYLAVPEARTSALVLLGLLGIVTRARMERRVRGSYGYNPLQPRPVRGHLGLAAREQSRCPRPGRATRMGSPEMPGGDRWRPIGRPG